MQEKIDSLHFEGFTLDRHARELRRGDGVLPVSGIALDLLIYLLENPGRPLSKSELLQAVWTGTSVGESNLSQNVFRLRKVLGSDSPIKTIHGYGYQFSAKVVVSQPASTSDDRSFPTVSPALLIGRAEKAPRIILRGVVEQIQHAWRPSLSALLCASLIICGTFFYLHPLRKHGARLLDRVSISRSAAPSRVDSLDVGLEQQLKIDGR